MGSLVTRVSKGESRGLTRSVTASTTATVLSASRPLRLPSTTTTATALSATAFVTAVDDLLHGRSRGWRPTGHCFYDFVNGQLFENVFLLIIMCNTAVMAVEAQYLGDCNGQRIGYLPTHGEIGWHDARATFVVLEWFFGIVFTMEMTVKLIALRRDVFKSYWNYLDAMVVLFFLLWAVVGSDLPKIVVSLTRLARTLRIAKLLRALQEYEALYLMLTSIVGSMQVLAWSAVLLFLAQVFFALALQLIVQNYLEDETIDTEVLRQLYQYFGSFLRSMLTMFEITFGNWYTPCRVLVENCSEWFMIFFISHLLVIGFASIAVINGVFINETFKVAQQDDKYMLMRQEQDDKFHGAKMKRLFVAADLDGSGGIGKREFATICTMPDVQKWLSSMQIDFNDTDTFFELIDEDGDKTLTVEELVAGVARLKGQAKAFEIAELKHCQRDVLEQLTELNCQIRTIGQTSKSSHEPSCFPWTTQNEFEA